MGSFRAGLGQVDFTPPPGLPFMGHFRDDYAAKGTHDPLFCRAMVIEDDAGTRVAIVSLDICMLDRHQAGFMRNHIEKSCGIAAGNILITTTHTHGGPATVVLYHSPKATDEDIERFLSKACEAVEQANRSMRDVDLSIGYAAETRVSFNRRLKCRDGRAHMNWEELAEDFVLEPLGPIDPELIALTVAEQGRPCGCLTNFALHAAIIDYENTLYTADFPGYVAEALCKTYGKDFLSLYCQGCCGNINHIDWSDHNAPRRGFVMSQRVGYMIAADVVEAIRQGEMLSGGELKVTSETVELERYKIGDADYAKARQFLQDGCTDSQDQELDGLPERFMAPVLVRMHEHQDRCDRVEVTAIRVGDLAVVGLPGEVFCELGMEIKRRSQARHTIVIELANDAIGYLPTKEAFPQGGYEITPGATQYEEGAGERIMEAAIRQIGKLFEA